MKALCLGALAAACPLAVLAQPPQPDPSQADARVPAPVYRSDWRVPPPAAAPDGLDWKKANAEVGQFRRGHVDLLQWEAGRRAPTASPPPAHRH